MRRLACLLLLAAAPAVAQTGAAVAEAQGRFVRALTAIAIEDFETAERSLDEVLEQAPDDPTVLMLRSDVAAQRGASADAVFFARRATDVAPDRAEAWLAFATALRTASQPAEAATVLARARDLAPTDVDVLTASADLAADMGDEATERDVLRALVRVGDTVAARLRLSALAQQAGDADEALAQAQAAARIGSSQDAVRRRIAELQGAARPASAPASTEADGAALFAAGRFDAAADALLAEIDADPRQIDRWALALQALAQTTDDRAGATADDALLLFPSVPSVLVGAAEAYAAAGRAGDARDAATRAADALSRLDDDLPDAPALRARIDAVLSR